MEKYAASMSSTLPTGVRIVLSEKVWVAWQSGRQRDVSRIHSLSLGGLFILTPDPPPVGALVKLLLDLPSGEVRARAVIRHAKQGKGMGIKFVSMGQEGRARLKQLMAELLQSYSHALLAKR
jgi:hypothetical protein